MEKVVKRNGNKEESCSTLTSINNFTGESAKQRTCVGYSGVQPLLFVIEREGLDFSQCKKREFWLKPTLVRCFALLPVKLFMEVSVHIFLFPLSLSLCVCVLRTSFNGVPPTF
jgi:hypothetical protein